ASFGVAHGSPAFVQREVFSPDGEISRVEVTAGPLFDKEDMEKIPAPVVWLHETGASAGRFNFVFVGDGYSSEDLDLYRQHAASSWDTILAQEPFATYRNYINAHRVIIKSVDSGVSQDPPPIVKDTPLGMNYFCGEIPRLLCVDEKKAQAYALNAPKSDQVIAIANSATYGGAGGKVATVAGANAKASQILLHELGHSLGSLTDEYVLKDVTYSGNEIEPSPSWHKRNVSIFPAEEMLARGLKWFLWMGVSALDGGNVGTFEGASDGANGVYRPTENSLMRSLGKPFNPPGLEAMVIGIYRVTGAIDQHSPVAVQVKPTARLSVKPFEPIGHELEIRWYLDGHRLSALDNLRTLNLSSLNLIGPHSVNVVVSDPTPCVRDSL
ncbi:MAG: M64 family metallopeptidase, partial [Bdellovibrionota bacterium]